MKYNLISQLQTFSLAIAFYLFPTDFYTFNNRLHITLLYVAKIYLNDRGDYQQPKGAYSHKIQDLRVLPIPTSSSTIHYGSDFSSRKSISAYL